MSREDESELVEPAQELPNYNEAEAIAFIQKAGLVRGRHETVVRETVVAGFFLMFPTATRPWWVERHTRGAESLLEFYDEKQTIGYADSIVGLTAIEYESDLTNTSKLRKGKHQVHQYCTGLLQTLEPTQARSRGVLSDGVEWRAYELVGTYEKETGHLRRQ